MDLRSRNDGAGTRPALWPALFLLSSIGCVQMGELQGGGSASDGGAGGAGSTTPIGGNAGDDGGVPAAGAPAGGGPGQGGDTAEGGAPPVGTPIFRMDCGADGESYPVCGFTNTKGDEYLGAFWERAYVPAAGPEGQGVVQFDHLESAVDAEYYAGWEWQDAPDVEQGATRYLRFKLKLLSPILWHGPAGPEQRFGGKFIILGDHGDDWTRVISNVRSAPENTGQVIFRTERNIAGAPLRMDSEPLQPDVWHAIQIKVRSSTSLESGDGHLYMYIDGDNASESSPTIESSGDDQINSYGWHETLGFGFYFQALGVGGHAAYQVVDFEYDDEFVSNW